MIAAAKVKALTRSSWPHYKGDGGIAFEDSFGQSPSVAQYNRLLHELLGRGSFAKVWGLGGLSNVCVKVAVGGIATDGLDRKGEETHTPTLQYGYYTSGCVVRTLNHGEIGMVLYHEFMRVRSIAAHSLPSGETRPLYARAQFFGVVGSTAYYTMERLYGCNMRHVLSGAHKNVVDQVNAIDFAPLVQRLLRSMHHLVSTYGAFHGDMKPENIMLVADEYASPHGELCSYSPFQRRGL